MTVSLFPEQKMRWNLPDYQPDGGGDYDVVSIIKHKKAGGNLLVVL